jgi:ABC-type polysaccharide/polyol phosphate export permease
MDLLLGQLAWTFFSGSVLMSTGSIVDNAGLLRTVLFPSTRSMWVIGRPPHCLQSDR